MEDDENSAALALLDAPELSREGCFPVRLRIHARRLKDTLKKQHRRAASAFIKAANADSLARRLPGRIDIPTLSLSDAIAGRPLSRK